MNVPLADMMNHSPFSDNAVDIIQKQIHLQDNKIYRHKHNFKKKSGNDNQVEELYDFSVDRQKIDCTRLYRED